MPQSFIESLNIEEVTQTQIFSNRIEIYFKINGFHYCLITHTNKNDKFQPASIEHVRLKIEDKTRCQLCSSFYFCDKLNEHINELFERLITFHSIRLHWLYLSH